MQRREIGHPRRQRLKGTTEMAISKYNEGHEYTYSGQAISSESRERGIANANETKRSKGAMLCIRCGAKKLTPRFQMCKPCQDDPELRQAQREANASMIRANWNKIEAYERQWKADRAAGIAFAD